MSEQEEDELNSDSQGLILGWIAINHLKIRNRGNRRGWRDKNDKLSTHIETSQNLKI